jgi:ATP-binding cassette subfamily C protein CydD
MKLNRRLLHHARGAQRDLILAVGLGLLAGIMLVGQAHFLSRTVHQVFLQNRPLNDVMGALGALLALALLRAATVWGSEIAAGRVARHVKTELREHLATRLFDLGPAYTQGQRTGELTHTLTEGVEALDAYFGQYLPQLALAALVPLAVLGFVFPRDWLSGLVLLLTAPLLPLFMLLIGNLAERLTRQQWTVLSRMSAHILDMLQGLTTLKLLGRSKDQIQAVRRISDEYRRTTLDVLRVAFLSALVMELVATLSTAIVAVEIGLRLLYGRMGFEAAFFILLLAPEFYLPLRQLGARFHAGMAGVAAAERIFQILDTKDRHSTNPTYPTFSGNIPGEAGIRFEGVHYAYADGQRQALNDTSFFIPRGRRVALVGPSGAGKSTVAQLLLRFITPQQGTIAVDGLPLHHIPVQTWRGRVAWVPQHPYLFHASVADNIRLARPEAGRDAVVRAAQQAHAHAFIRDLPDGYDTQVGERGARLSGGQAQRIALARAFLKDATLLILDEATANLDPHHEQRLQEALERLIQGRTVLVIAHRLATVYRADLILVMAGGRVVESGTHPTLMAREGLYHRLVTASQPDARPYAPPGAQDRWKVGERL